MTVFSYPRRTWRPWPRTTAASTAGRSNWHSAGAMGCRLRYWRLRAAPANCATGWRPSASRTGLCEYGVFISVARKTHSFFERCHSRKKQRAKKRPLKFRGLYPSTTNRGGRVKIHDKACSHLLGWLSFWKVPNTWIKNCEWLQLMPRFSYTAALPTDQPTSRNTHQ